MTLGQVPLNDPTALRAVLAATDALLLDFDGPICSVFAGLPADRVAQRLRDVLRDDLPAEVEKTEDPFVVLHYAAELGAHELRAVEAVLRDSEVEAVESAEPTPGAHDLIRTWPRTGRKLAVVSNNSAAAVHAYLDRTGLLDHIDAVSARTEPAPALLKPAPHLLHQACARLSVATGRSTLVGDSLTDLEAAKAAHTNAIGYANKPGKVELFTAERPEVVITDMSTLVSALT
ncbi:HAD family hydrolase [Saccharothrix violaceirubra]|uniref:HAD superfamily hydrolase (TIGR01509 family) n=1 Tax=Saccharothrix violaceirubra TaxID=413306 RepID=A0A7W7SXC0_9PSEU|nr:HAD family phosphatase [Saccharothrix violaceirubra]MBB4962679.1 HAD superfamily hydrolase (TIGR01509 family) [Saccharothrix violaceirubra]